MGTIKAGVEFGQPYLGQTICPKESKLNQNKINQFPQNTLNHVGMSVGVAGGAVWSVAWQQRWLTAIFTTKYDEVTIQLSFELYGLPKLV